MDQQTAPATQLAAAAPLAAPQHKAALWADESLQVYAVVMGSRIAGLPQRLAAAGSEIADYDCLLPGALEPQAQQDAPYLVQLRPDSAFTDWLLFEAAASLAEWGVLVRSTARLMPLRNHLRELLAAVLPGGERIALEWMDPVVLQAVLPLFGPAELSAFFGPVRALVVPGVSSWRHAESQLGRLAQRDIPLAKAA
ncbi:DUF4123 domain-containing protein [Xylophilus rhododendri]|uniref:DUF4123 domain-containing protein n=1 Tax=Xylophilus rhododendri TaxID=2697032 RepID=A0A857JAM9_9BURK|nr:DUF4123 domain-containing protein [Xylophilus rhododendri]QHJ00977.1 DUF4123 domain-containing protein [Xylophilus rhododendri]